MKKLLVLVLMLPFITSGCTGSNNYYGGYSSDDTYYNELEEKCNELETENQELRDRLDEINTLATDRYDNYGNILDEIEYESDY